MKRRPLFLNFRLVAVSALWFACANARASTAKQTFPTDPLSGIEITVESDFDNVPISGFAPFHVTIQNNSAKEGVWDLVFLSSPFRGQTTSVFHFAVEGGQTRTFPVLALQAASYGWQSTAVSCSGPGVDSTSRLSPGRQAVMRFAEMCRFLP